MSVTNVTGENTQKKARKEWSVLLVLDLKCDGPTFVVLRAGWYAVSLMGKIWYRYIWPINPHPKKRKSNWYKSVAVQIKMSGNQKAVLIDPPLAG